ncbi:MAG: hypothetical protein FWD58_08675, partial [Firmicutes bacterium]|nr:hypothetical protein [Bacillota bacterium]
MATRKGKQFRGEAVQTDSSAKMKKIERESEKPGCKCSCCGKVYPMQKGNFSVSNSKLFAGNGGYITMCRLCLEKYYRQLVAFYDGNVELAIEHCCRLFDWYYHSDAAAATVNASLSYSRIMIYPSKMNMAQIKSKGTCFLDTLRDRRDRILEIGAASELGADPEAAPPVDEKIVKFFGFGYTPEEYGYLYEQYKDWSTRYECQT